MIKYLDLKTITGLHLDEIEEAANRVIKSGWYLQGAETEHFENEYARYIGTQYCVGTGNGLDALTLILRAYIQLGKLQAGDEVIVPANTFIASILAITRNRLRPIFVEPRFNTLEIDDSLIESKITSHTRAILLVHLYGRCAYTDRIGEICSTHRLLLIEDNAQAQGCHFDNRRTGAIGDAAGHSFYPAKNLGALADAGAVTTDDEQLADVVRSLGNYGSAHKYEFEYCGLNSRIDELSAAILSVKLRYLDAENACRRHIADLLYHGIANPSIILPDRMSARNNVYHIFPIFTTHRKRLQDYLSTRGIETAIHYPIPPHRQTCLAEYASLSLPITERIHAEELSIPLNQTLTDDDADKMIEALNSFTDQD